MDFLRFTTKQSWRKVVEEPNSEEKTRLFCWCFYVDAERKRLDIQRCLWGLLLYFIVIYNGSSSIRSWLLEVVAVPENDSSRWESPVPVLRETETVQTKKERGT